MTANYIGIMANAGHQEIIKVFVMKIYCVEQRHKDKRFAIKIIKFVNVKMMNTLIIYLKSVVSDNNWIIFKESWFTFFF